jgi:hypothetical protein
VNKFKTLVLGTAMAVPFATTLLASASPANLIANGTFDSSVAGWDNFSGNPTLYKHSMQITNGYTGNGNSYYSGWYCIKNVKPGATYETEGDFWVPLDAPANTGADLSTFYYASNDCSGGNLVTGGGGKSGGRTADQRGVWVHVDFKSTAPDAAHSMRVRATAFKEPKAPATSIPAEHVVYFDNISTVQELTIVAPPTATPTQQPQGPGDIVAQPTATPTKNPGDIVSNPQPTATPQAPDTGDAEPTDGDNGDSNVDANANNGDGAGNADTSNSQDANASDNHGNGSSTHNSQSQTGASGHTSSQAGNSQHASKDDAGLSTAIVVGGAGAVLALCGLAIMALLRGRKRAE